MSQSFEKFWDDSKAEKFQETARMAWNAALDCAAEEARNASSFGGTVTLRETIISAIKEKKA